MTKLTKPRTAEEQDRQQEEKMLGERYRHQVGDRRKNLAKAAELIGFSRSEISELERLYAPNSERNKT